MRVDSYVREREGKAGIGMIEQSLCHHLQSRLTEYYRLIAILESQMAASTSREGPADVAGTDEPNPPRETALTLKRLDVWIQEWRLRMRMMSVCVEGARGITLNLFSGCVVPLTVSATRCPWWGARQFDPRLRGQWGPLRSKVHWATSGRGGFHPIARATSTHHR